MEVGNYARLLHICATTAAQAVASPLPYKPRNQGRQAVSFYSGPVILRRTVPYL